MTILNTFMKRRIQQLVEETQDPEQVLELLDDALEDKEEHEREEIMAYVSQVMLETPQDGLMGRSPKDLIELAFAREMGQEIPHEDSMILDQMESVGRQSIMRIAFEALEYLNNQMARDERDIRSGKIDLSKFEKSIHSLPIIDDIRKFLQFVDGQKNGYIKTTKKASIGLRDYKKIHKLLKDSPNILLKEPLKGREEELYIRFLRDILQDSSILRMEESQLHVGDTGKNFLRGKNITGVFLKILKAWWLSVYWSVFYSDNTLYTLWSDEVPQINNLMVLLSTGKKWREAEEIAALLSYIQFRDTSDLFDLETEFFLPYDEELIESFIKYFIRGFEYLGILKKRKKENRWQIKLTPMGHYLLKRLFEFYHPICRIHAKFNFYKAKIALCEYLIDKTSEMNDEIDEQSELFEYINKIMEFRNFYIAFLEDVVDHGGEGEEEDLKEYEEINQEFFNELEAVLKKCRKSLAGN